jgi:ZIP family zinc transporter
VVDTHPAFNPVFMAFAAGAMIYISLHELVPMARLYRHSGLFIAGAILSVVLYLALGLLLPA